MNGSSYREKPRGYFSGARVEFIDSLRLDPEARLLDVGCGTGSTGAYALSTGKCGVAIGVELCEGPAQEAKRHLTQVLIGNIEEIDLPFTDSSFDVVVLSEVLEHLQDPEAVLRRLHRCLKPGGIVLAGSPNIAHYSTILMLLRGEWRLAESGVMDRTHLRWFTPSTYRNLFLNSGFEVITVEPARDLHRKASIFNRFTFGKLKHLLHSQTVLRAICKK